MSLSREDAAIVGAYTGVLCGPFEDLHAYIERKMGRPVFTHELGDPETRKKIAVVALDDFLSICASREETP